MLVLRDRPGFCLRLSVELALDRRRGPDPRARAARAAASAAPALLPPGRAGVVERSTPCHWPQICAPTGTLETPAMRGKRLRADELGERVVIARNWRYLAYGLLLVQTLSLAVIGYLASRPMLVPVYIEVETASGSARVLARGEQEYGLRQESVKKELREFVQVLRRVSPDKHLMQQQWKALFQKVTPRAYRTLSLYAQQIDPLAVEGERRVEILRELAQTEQTYDIRWMETTYNADGALQERATYSGIFTWSQAPGHGQPACAGRRYAPTPSGFWLEAWQWSKEP